MGGYEVPSNAVHIDIPSDDDDNDDGGRVKKARKLRRTVRKKDKKLKRITLRGITLAKYMFSLLLCWGSDVILMFSF